MNDPRRTRPTLPPTPSRHAIATAAAWLAWIALIVLMLVGCTAPGAAPPGALTAPEQRITDGRIDADQKAYAAQQDSIRALNDSGKQPLRGYAISKAQCWLDVSQHEYSRNDRSAFPQQAFDESRKITAFLQGGAGGGDNPAQATPLVNDAERLRPDLWAEADALKKNAGFACAEQLTACAEVELVHAGNEQRQQGWRHAKPYVQIAEDKLADARLAADACAKPAAAPATAPVVAAAPPPPPLPPARSVEKINLSAGALFKFGKRSLADLLPAGRAELDALAKRLTAGYASIERIALTGYTDRLGSAANNQKLSADRAETVKAYLQGKVGGAQISAQGRGADDPVVQCPGTKVTPALTACLQPNRRVEVVVEGVKAP